MTTGTSELDRWREQIRRGGLELAILVALSGAPRYGLEVIRHLEDAMHATKEGVPVKTWTPVSVVFMLPR